MSRPREPGSFDGRVRTIVEERGPIRTREVVAAMRRVGSVFPDQARRVGTTLARLAARGHIDRIAPGLYDRLGGA